MPSDENSNTRGSRRGSPTRCAFVQSAPHSIPSGAVHAFPLASVQNAKDRKWQLRYGMNSDKLRPFPKE